LRLFSLAHHSHDGTGALSARRPRWAARASRSAAASPPKNTTGQSTVRCPAQRELKVGREQWAKAGAYSGSWLSPATNWCRSRLTKKSVRPAFSDKAASTQQRRTCSPSRR
jgi:hypothetical protein